VANQAECLARLHQDREEIRRAVVAANQRHADGRRAVEDLVERYNQLRAALRRAEDRELVDACLGGSIAAAATAFGVP
jgi:hypothetical protein